MMAANGNGAGGLDAIRVEAADPLDFTKDPDFADFEITRDHLGQHAADKKSDLKISVTPEFDGARVFHRRNKEQTLATGEIRHGSILVVDLGDICRVDCAARDSNPVDPGGCPKHRVRAYVRNNNIIFTRQLIEP